MPAPILGVAPVWFASFAFKCSRSVWLWAPKGGSRRRHWLGWSFNFPRRLHRRFGSLRPALAVCWREGNYLTFCFSVFFFIVFFPFVELWGGGGKSQSLPCNLLTLYGFYVFSSWPLVLCFCLIEMIDSFSLENDFWCQEKFPYSDNTIFLCWNVCRVYLCTIFSLFSARKRKYVHFWERKSLDLIMRNGVWPPLHKSDLNSCRSGS